MSEDTITAAIDAAAEQLRAANHALVGGRGGRPDSATMYARVGGLSDVLGKLEQAVRHIGDRGEGLAARQDLYADDGADPAGHARNAAHRLHRAAGALLDVLVDVDAAYSALSHLGTREE